MVAGCQGSKIGFSTDARKNTGIQTGFHNDHNKELISPQPKGGRRGLVYSGVMPGSTFFIPKDKLYKEIEIEEGLSAE
jgi:hypothetical protein